MTEIELLGSKDISKVLIWRTAASSGRNVKCSEGGFHSRDFVTSQV